MKCILTVIFILLFSLSNYAGEMNPQTWQYQPPNIVTWFAAFNGQQPQPVGTAETLLSLIATGAITRETPVWRNGMSNWLPAGQIPELSMAFAAATPPPLPNSSMQQSSIAPVGAVPSTLESMIINPTQQQFIDALLFMEKKRIAIFHDKRLTDLRRNSLYKSLPNEKLDRMKQALRGNSNVNDWVGIVENISESGNGARELTVKIYDGVVLASDPDERSRAFINKSSALYSALESLSLGDTIYFSGEFFPGVNENFVATVGLGSVPRPQTSDVLEFFYFRFTSIKNKATGEIATDTSSFNSPLKIMDPTAENASEGTYTPFEFGNNQNNSAYNDAPSQTQPNENASTAKKVLTGVAGAALNQLFGR